MDYHSWLTELKGCLQDMGAMTYNEAEARRLYKEGVDPATAAADLIEEDQGGVA